MSGGYTNLDPEHQVRFRVLDKGLSDCCISLGGWHEFEGTKHYVVDHEQAAICLDRITEMILNTENIERRLLLQLFAERHIIHEYLLPIVTEKHKVDLHTVRRVMRVLVLITEPVTKKGSTAAEALSHVSEWNHGDPHVRAHLECLHSFKEDMAREALIASLFEMVMSCVDDQIDFKIVDDHKALEKNLKANKAKQDIDFEINLKEDHEDENEKMNLSEYEKGVLAHDCLKLIRNLLTITDPAPSFQGYNESRGHMHLRYVKLIAKNDGMLSFLAHWADEESKKKKEWIEYTDDEKQARWILFDIIYAIIIKLSAEEVVNAEVNKDVLREYLNKTTRSKVVTTHNPELSGVKSHTKTGNGAPSNDPRVKMENGKRPSLSASATTKSRPPLSLMTSVPPIRRHAGFGVSTNVRMLLGDKTLKLERENMTKARVPLKKKFTGKLNSKKDMLTSDPLFADLTPATGAAAEHNKFNPFASSTSLAEGLDPEAFKAIREFLANILDSDESEEQEEGAETSDVFSGSHLCKFVVQQLRDEEARIQEEMRINPEQEQLDNDTESKRNMNITYYTKSKLFNFLSFFLEFYRLYCHKRRKTDKTRYAEPQVVEGFVDLATIRYLSDEMRKEGRDMGLNPERLIIVMRASVEQMLILGDFCRTKDKNNKMLAEVLVENFIGRSIGQRLIEVLKLYKPKTHEPRVLSYAIEAMHLCCLLMEEVTPKDQKEAREFQVVKFGTVSHGVTIDDYIKQLSNWGILQNLFTMLESYHVTNKNQLYYTCKLIKRVVRAHFSNVAVFYNLRFFARLQMIIRSEYVQDNPELFKEMHSLFRMIILSFTQVHQTNKLALTELIMNCVLGKEDLAGNHDVWEGIVRNYDTPIWTRNFDMVALDTYANILEKLKQEKKQDRKFTQQEDEEIKTIYHRLKDKIQNSGHLLTRIMGEIQHFEGAEVTKKDLRIRMQDLGLIAAAVKLTKRDLPEKLAIFIKSNAPIQEGGSGERRLSNSAKNSPYVLLGRVAETLRRVQLTQQSQEFECEFTLEETGLIKEFVDVMKCLDAKRVKEKKAGKAAGATVEVEEQLRGGDESDLEDENWRFKLPIHATEALEDLKKFTSMSVDGISRYLPADFYKKKRKKGGKGEEVSRGGGILGVGKREIIRDATEEEWETWNAHARKQCKIAMGPLPAIEEVPEEEVTQLERDLTSEVFNAEEDLTFPDELQEKWDDIQQAEREKRNKKNATGVNVKKELKGSYMSMTLETMEYGGTNTLETFVETVNTQVVVGNGQSSSSSAMPGNNMNGTMGSNKDGVQKVDVELRTEGAKQLFAVPIQNSSKYRTAWEQKYPNSWRYAYLPSAQMQSADIYLYESDDFISRLRASTLGSNAPLDTTGLRRIERGKVVRQVPTNLNNFNESQMRGNNNMNDGNSMNRMGGSMNYDGSMNIDSQPGLQRKRSRIKNPLSAVQEEVGVGEDPSILNNSFENTAKRRKIKTEQPSSQDPKGSPYSAADFEDLFDGTVDDMDLENNTSGVGFASGNGLSSNSSENYFASNSSVADVLNIDGPGIKQEDEFLVDDNEEADMKDSERRRKEYLAQIDAELDEMDEDEIEELARLEQEMKDDLNADWDLCNRTQIEEALPEFTTKIKEALPGLLKEQEKMVQREKAEKARLEKASQMAEQANRERQKEKESAEEEQDSQVKGSQDEMLKVPTPARTKIKSENKDLDTLAAELENDLEGFDFEEFMDS